MKKNAVLVGILVFVISLFVGTVCIVLIPDLYEYNIFGKLFFLFTDDLAAIQILEFCSWLMICVLSFLVTYFLVDKSSIEGSAAIAMFVLVLFIPGLLGWGVDLPLEDTENRAMAEKPLWTNTNKSEYFSRMDAYLADSVPFRKLWLRNNGLVKYGIFQSSLKMLSMPGKDGWIYIGNSGQGSGEDPVADYEQTNLFTEDELEDLSHSLQGFKNYLTAQGIDFRLMINLNKSHIYPEYLPNEIWAGEGETRAEQLIQYLNENTDIEVVYPKDALLDKKNDYLLYCPTDAHWNTVGGYIGFTELMKTIDPAFAEVSIEDINPVYEKTNWGDVANIINASWFTNNLWTTTSYKPKVQLEWVYRTEEDAGLYINNADGNGKKILVYHDSYMNQMMEYLGKEYSTGEFIEKEFDISENDIEEKNPDIVVFEILERMINNYTDELRYWQKYR